MDTGTHLVFGLGLAGLAHIDPVIASDQSHIIAVMVGTVIGSQIPDADGLMRLKNNAAYIRNHRGLSHSLPAMVVWTLLIVGVLVCLFDHLPVWHVGFWVGLAVCVHVGSDLFNTYGTQGLRPFSQKWISWNIIHIFDPFIFTSHVIAIVIWSLGLVEPHFIFPTLYVLIVCYYMWRTLVHHQLKKNLLHQDTYFETGDTYELFTTYHIHVWHVLKVKKNGLFVLGELKSGRLNWVDAVKCENHPAIDASKHHEDVQAMLYFSSYACPSVKLHTWGYEVRWSDIRYRYRKQYPFVAVVVMNFEFEILDTFTGWVSESKLEKKLRLDLY